MLGSIWLRWSYIIAKLCATSRLSAIARAAASFPWTSSLRSFQRSYHCSHSTVMISMDFSWYSMLPTPCRSSDFKPSSHLQWASCIDFIQQCVCLPPNFMKSRILQNCVETTSNKLIPCSISVELQRVFTHDEQGDDVRPRSSTEYQELVEVCIVMVNG